LVLSNNAMPLVSRMYGWKVCLDFKRGILHPVSFV
jgi:hypothetical protein